MQPYMAATAVKGLTNNLSLLPSWASHLLWLVLLKLTNAM